MTYCSHDIMWRTGVPTVVAKHTGKREVLNIVVSCVYILFIDSFTQLFLPPAPTSPMLRAYSQYGHVCFTSHGSLHAQFAKNHGRTSFLLPANLTGVSTLQWPDCFVAYARWRLGHHPSKTCQVYQLRSSS